MAVLKLSKAAEILGYPNAPALRYAIKTGLLRVGYEVEDRRAKNSTRPSYWVDIERAKARFQQLPEKRR